LAEAKIRIAAATDEAALLTTLVDMGRRMAKKAPLRGE
jgi:hypothetical protein